MKWILFIVGGIALLIAVVALIGVFVPREHTATTRARFKASASTIFALLADVDGYPTWRDVKSGRWIEPVGGKKTFVEASSHGPLTYAIEESEPERKLVLRIADDSLPYGGTWTFALATDGSGTVVSITEHGFVKPVIFRTLARFVFGYHATMEGYLRALAKKLGETPAIERS